jgi:hypothetical protein
MPSELIAALITSVIGGLMVAVVNVIFTRRKTVAEIEKLSAEAQKIKAEAEHFAVQAEDIRKRWEVIENRQRTRMQVLVQLIETGALESYQMEEMAEETLTKILQAFQDDPLLDHLT